jgi:hypothetical protein
MSREDERKIKMNEITSPATVNNNSNMIEKKRRTTTINRQNSPSQKIQSQAQRKQVVASGVLHRLHRSDGGGSRAEDDRVDRVDLTD